MFRKIRTYRGRPSNSVLLYVCTQHFTQNVSIGDSRIAPPKRQTKHAFVCCRMAGCLAEHRLSGLNNRKRCRWFPGSSAAVIAMTAIPPRESPRHFAALRDESVIMGYYTSRRKCIPVPQPSATELKGADLYGQKMTESTVPLPVIRTCPPLMMWQKVQEHNEREKDNYSNQDIDTSQTHRNIHFKTPPTAMLPCSIR